MTTLLTRRTLFAAAGLPVVTVPAFASASVQTPAGAWAMARAIERHRDTYGPERDEEAEELTTRMFRLEDVALAAPITSKADAAAKCRAIGLSFERGLIDGDTETASLQQVISWLEAN